MESVLWGFAAFTLLPLWEVAFFVGWALCVVYSTEDDHPLLGFWSTVALVAILHFGGVVNFAYPLHHPWQALGYLIAYLLIGGPWAAIKWKSYLVSWREGVVEEFQRYGFSRRIDRTPEREPVISAPQVRDNKSRIFTWAAFWPLSLIWTFIQDPLRRFWNFVVFSVMGPFLQGISDKEAERARAEIKSLVPERASRVETYGDMSRGA